MTKKHWIILSAISVAVVAVVVALCLVFLGNKIVDATPSSVSVEEIDGNFYLITDYNAEFSYQFKVEQQLDGQYVTLKTVDSDKNICNLSSSGVDVVAGENYRFSARFVTENGAGNGEFCSPVQWMATWNLSEVDYSTLVFDEENETLSWDAIYQADSYRVLFVNGSGDVLTIDTQTNSCSVSSVPVGKFQVYVQGVSTDNNLLPSFVGDGVSLAVKRTNEIVDVQRDNLSLHVTCLQYVQEFQIFEDGVLKGTLTANSVEEESGRFVYLFDNAGLILNNLDFENAVVQIKSLANGCALESALIQIY